MLQYGYLTFFAVAFPLVSVCALLNNTVEIRTDASKLCKPSHHHINSSINPSILNHQLIPPFLSLFARFRPYLAHFSPVFSRLLRAFTVSTRRFQ